MPDTNTPLHIAVQNENIELIKVLLAGSSDFNVRNADGLTPLDLAIANNNVEIVRLLLEHGMVPTTPPPAQTSQASALLRKIPYPKAVLPVIKVLSPVVTVVSMGVKCMGWSQDGGE